MDNDFLDQIAEIAEDAAKQAAKTGTRVIVTVVDNSAEWENDGTGRGTSIKIQQNNIEITIAADPNPNSNPETEESKEIVISPSSGVYGG